MEFENPKLGVHTVKVKLVDDKGEPREKVITIYVVPPALPWIAILGLLLVFILAIFFAFSYSKRRRSRWEALHQTLDTILKWLPDPKKN
jgi:hypothetical protein